MKKRIFLVAGAIVAVGLILCFISFASVDFTVSGYASPEDAYEEKEYTVPEEEITKVLVVAHNMPITVEPSDGQDVTLKYFTSEKDPYEVSMADGVLILKCKNRNWLQNGSTSIFDSIQQANIQIRIYVPKTYAGAFELDTSNGKVALSGLTGAGDIMVDTSNAAVQIKKVNANRITIKTSNGSVTLDEIASIESIDMTSSNGGINLDKVGTKGNVVAATSNGSVIAKEIISEGLISLHSSNGSITVEQLLATDIELRSSNARITGSVVGTRDEYTILSINSNADNNLNPGGGNGAKRLTVETSNGAIQISFSGK